MSANEQQPSPPKLAMLEMTAQLGNDRTLAIRFNTPLEATEADVNVAVDKYLGVINRQQAKAALVGHRENIETQERKLRHMREDIEVIDEREARRADAAGAGGRKYKAPQQDIETRKAVVKQLERLEEDLEAMKKYEKKLEQEAGVVSEEKKAK